MSSRVQKGNTVFRPVVKARSRTATSSVSRQPSVVAEASSKVLLNSQALGPPTQTEQNILSGQTLPPDSRPVRGESEAFEQRSSQPSSSTRPAAVPVLIAPPSRSTPHQTPTPIAVGVQPAQRALYADETTDKEGTPCESVVVQSSLVLGAQAIPPDVLRQSNTTSAVLGEPLAQTSDPVVDSTSETLQQDVIEGPRKRRKSRKAMEAEETTPKRKKRRATTQDGESQSERSQSRGSSRTPRPRKRAPSPPPFDPTADPGEDIDPTSVTMASICADTGQGRISSKAIEILTNHAAWKVRNKEKRARMRAVMEAKKYGRNEEDVDEDIEARGGDGSGQKESQTVQPSSSAAQNEAGPSTPRDTPQATAPIDHSGDGFDYSQNLETSRYNVQVRIGPNGETIIDEESLLVDRVENDGTQNYTHITESDYTKFVNSATYGRKFRGSRWSAEETELFFEALSQYGENYELIACVLPGRDRKACKNKFKAEDKKNPARINYCLNNSIPVDMKTLARMTGKDFSGPVPEIRAPSLPPIQLDEPSGAGVNVEEPDDPPSTSKVTPVKKRSRSKSHGTLTDGDIIIVGNADGFEA